MDERPFGVTVLGIIAMVGGVFHLIPNALLLTGGVLGIFGGMYTTTGAAGAPASFGGLIQTGISLIGVIAALLLIVAGFGLLQVRSWAWPLAVLAAVIVLIGAATRLILLVTYEQGGDLFTRLLKPFGHGVAVVGETIALVLCVAALIYLFRPTVREAFGSYTDAAAPM
jgi:hypothetical protein